MTLPADIVELAPDEGPPDGAAPWALIVLTADGAPASMTLHDGGPDRAAPAAVVALSGADATLWAQGWADFKCGVVYLRREAA